MAIFGFKGSVAYELDIGPLVFQWVFDPQIERLGFGIGPFRINWWK